MFSAAERWHRFKGITSFIYFMNTVLLTSNEIYSLTINKLQGAKPPALDTWLVPGVMERK